jgi:PAS domain S-box
MLVEKPSEVVMIIDSDGTITYVSLSLTRTLGYEPEELVGEVGCEYQHPDDPETAFYRASVVSDTEGPSYRPASPK